MRLREGDFFPAFFAVLLQFFVIFFVEHAVVRFLWNEVIRRRPGENRGRE